MRRLSIIDLHTTGHQPLSNEDGTLMARSMPTRTCELGRPPRPSLRPMLRDHVLGKSFVERGLISPSFAARLIDEHEAGRRDNSTSLWSLLVLELWFAQNGL